MCVCVCVCVCVFSLSHTTDEYFVSIIFLQQARMEREIEVLRKQDMRARHELDRTLFHVNNAENALIRGV